MATHSVIEDLDVLSLVGRDVGDISPIHGPGLIDGELLVRQISATGSECAELVVALNFRFWMHRKPISRLKRAIWSRPRKVPVACNSVWRVIRR